MSNEQRLAVIDAEGREKIVLDGPSASATLGGNGHGGDLRLSDAAGLPTVLFDGSRGALELGGNGQPGELRLLDKEGRTGLQLGGGSSIVAGGFGSDGDLLLKDHTGAVVFHLDGGTANVDLGGRGHNADLRLKNASGDITLHLDAEKGELLVRGKAVKLGADHVFAPDHPLQTLGELRAFIEQHRHLPGIPSAAEMAERGVGMGELAIGLLEKVEELTLHVLALEERLRALEGKA